MLRSESGYSSSPWCAGQWDWTCALHAVSEVVQLQCAALRVDDRKRLANEWVPLISQKGDPWAAVDKMVLVSEAQRHFKRWQQMKGDFDVCASQITGHFVRRSGIKHLARFGCAFATMPWYARRPSQVMGLYRGILG